MILYPESMTSYFHLIQAKGPGERERTDFFVVDEDPRKGLEGTRSIIPDGSSSVMLEGERLDSGASGQVSEDMSVYEEYLQCVSCLDHLRKGQNQAPADVMTLPADQRTDLSKRSVRAPAELLVAEQPVHQNIPNEGRSALFMNSEVKNSRSMGLIKDPYPIHALYT